MFFLTDKVSLNEWPDRQEITRNRVLSLPAVADHGQIQWYWNGQPLTERSNITRTLTRIGDEIVKDEQTLRLTGESRSGIYQVLATGFNEQASKHTEVTAYSK